MAQGLAYDSDEGRAQAAAITALMTGHAYATSAKIAKNVGPFAGYHKDREAMNKVLKMHRDEVKKIDPAKVAEELLSAAASAWDEAVELSALYGVRNSQASVLAPTGTIAFFMDCDTTGIEPDFALTKHKKLVGGGNMVIVNQTVPRALKTLGYNRGQIEDILNYIDVEMTIVGAPHLKKEHESVFACSVGDNAIHYLGHVKMMGAVQPFISGAISKTVNMPEQVTVEEVEALNMEAWKLGLKAVAIYRDNCKVAQPLASAKKEGDKQESPAAESAMAEAGLARVGGVREELPRIRNSKVFKFTLAGTRGYIIVGEYPDGRPGELFVSIAKQGSTLRGIMDAFAVAISHSLQYGVPLKKLVKTFTHISFAPAGITDDPQIRTASSLIDYIFRRLGKSYLNFDDQLEVGLAHIDDMPEGQTSLLASEVVGVVNDAEQSLEVAKEIVAEATAKVEVATASTAELLENPAKIGTEPVDPAPAASSQRDPVQDPNAPMCYTCGNQTQRAGTCYVCTTCGTTSGCS